MSQLPLGQIVRASSRHCLRVNASEGSLCAPANGAAWGWVVAAVAPEDAMTAVKTATAAQYENRDMVFSSGDRRRRDVTWRFGAPKTWRRLRRIAAVYFRFANGGAAGQCVGFFPAITTRENLCPAASPRRAAQ